MKSLLLKVTAVWIVLFGAVSCRLAQTPMATTTAVQAAEIGPTATSSGISATNAPTTPTTPAETAADARNFLPSVIVPEESSGRWELYEITLTSTRDYPNPFTDVELYADFTSPTNRTIRVFGFYDGDGQGGQGNLWKIRFMADELGGWRWQTSASDSGNAGLIVQSGTFEVIESAAPGPLAPDPNHPNAWRHANGKYFLWNLGYSIHIAGADRTHPGVGGWQDYLDWLAAHRFNGVMFTLQVASFAACSTCQKGMAPWEAIGNHPPPTYAVNRNGRVDYFVQPWARQGAPDQFADRQENADFNRFYLPFWHNVDAIISEMQEKQMIAHILQYDDQVFWPPANSAEEQLYWDYLLRRLGAYWNVVFNDGIDLGEYRPIPAWVTEWQQYFHDNDPFQHPRSSRHVDDDGALATWRSVQAANDTAPQQISNWRNLLEAAPRKPVTEDDGIRSGKDNGITPARFMQLAWWSVLAGPGAFGATWAELYAPGNWYANLDAQAEGMLRVEHRNRFVLDFDPAAGKQIPFWKLVANDDLVTGDNVYGAAVPGLHYLVYFDEGAPGSSELDLSASTTSLPVTWLNPVTGERMSGGMTAPGAGQTFSNPFDGPAVLYVGAAE